MLAWGAINALPHPTSPTDVQTAFQFDYSGGWKTHQNASFWRTVQERLRRLHGPALPFFVAGCDAPDGCYWALQSWQRNLPMRGFAPWTDAQKAVELHLSHWSGDLPALEIYQHWTYGNAQQGFFGRLVYDGQPVFGTRSASATVNDPWARNIYIDTYNSDYGPGWKHDTAISTHPGNGGFCYTFVAPGAAGGLPERQAERQRARSAVPGHRHGAGRNAYCAVGRAESRPFRPGPELPRNTGVRPDSRGGRALRAGTLMTYDRAGFRAPRRKGIEARPLPSPRPRTRGRARRRKRVRPRSFLLFGPNARAVTAAARRPHGWGVGLRARAPPGAPPSRRGGAPELSPVEQPAHGAGGDDVLTGPQDNDPDGRPRRRDVGVGLRVPVRVDIEPDAEEGEPGATARARRRSARRRRP